MKSATLFLIKNQQSDPHLLNSKYDIHANFQFCPLFIWRIFSFNSDVFLQMALKVIVFTRSKNHRPRTIPHLPTKFNGDTIRGNYIRRSPSICVIWLLKTLKNPLWCSTYFLFIMRTIKYITCATCSLKMFADNNIKTPRTFSLTQQAIVNRFFTAYALQKNNPENPHGFILWHWFNFNLITSKWAAQEKSLIESPSKKTLKSCHCEQLILRVHPEAAPVLS